MATFKKPTATQFKQLLLSCIDNSGYNEIELVTDADKLTFAAETICQELPHLMQAGRVTAEQCQHWLQGLASACTIPFYNSEIVTWWCACAGMNELVSDKHCDMICEQYWVMAAQALQVMLNRTLDGHKVAI